MILRTYNDETSEYQIVEIAFVKETLIKMQTQWLHTLQLFVDRFIQDTDMFHLAITKRYEDENYGEYIFKYPKPYLEVLQTITVLYKDKINLDKLRTINNYNAKGVVEVDADDNYLAFYAKRYQLLTTTFVERCEEHIYSDYFLDSKKNRIYFPQEYQDFWLKLAHNPFL